MIESITCAHTPKGKESSNHAGTCISERVAKFGKDVTRRPWLKMVPLLTSPGLFLDTILDTLSAYVVCMLKV